MRAKDILPRFRATRPRRPRCGPGAHLRAALRAPRRGSTPTATILGRFAAAFLLGAVACGRDHPASPAAPVAEPLVPGEEKAAPPRRWEAEPRTFLGGVRLGSLAATPQLMLATTVGVAADKLVRIDEAGTLHSFVPSFTAPHDQVCHVVISPGRHPAFPAGEVFVSAGSALWRLRPAEGSAQTILTLAPSHGEIAGLCFDTTGAFGHALMILATDGSVLHIGTDFLPTVLGVMRPGGGGPSVMTLPSGPHFVAAFPSSGDVLGLTPRGDVLRVTGWSGATTALAFPETPVGYGRTGGALFVATAAGELLQFSVADVGSHPGALLLTSLHVSGSGIATPIGTHIGFDAWSRHRGPEVAAAFVQRQALSWIEIDVQPSTPDAPLLFGSPTPVPVALLGASWFETNMIDAASVVCAGAAPVPGGKSGYGTFSDVNDDGEMDLILSFRPSEMSIDPGTTDVELSGRTFAADAFVGKSAVQVSVSLLIPGRLTPQVGIPAIAR